jgi:RNA polymerase sigma-70 factor, ECF subfamily
MLVKAVMRRDHADDSKLEQPSDEALMRRVCAGDREAYGLLLSRYWVPLVSYAAGIVGAQDAAEDVAQDAFIRVWVRRTAWTPTGAVSAYVYRITRNLALNARRDSASATERSQRAGSGSVASAGQADPEQDFSARVLSRDVDAAIAALPERRREVFILSRFHGLSYREIGETMDIAVQTVANQMSAALADLREHLARHLDED